MKKDGKHKGQNETRKNSIPVVGSYVKLDSQAYCIENLFMENYYIRVRDCVRSSIAKMSGNEDVYLGYIYKTDDGKYEMYYVSGGIKNAAKFICSSADNKMLCNSDDHPLLCSIGDYLDLIRSEEGVKERLIKELKKYQGKRERPEFDKW